MLSTTCVWGHIFRAKCVFTQRKCVFFIFPFEHVECVFSVYWEGDGGSCTYWTCVNCIWSQMNSFTQTEAFLCFLTGCVDPNMSTTATTDCRSCLSVCLLTKVILWWVQVVSTFRWTFFYHVKEWHLLRRMSKQRSHIIFLCFLKTLSKLF